MLTRREFLGRSAAAAAVVALGCTSSDPGAGPTEGDLPDPIRTGIDHVVVVMMENRSFDHLLGWLPGADGRQAGLTFVDVTGNRYATRHWADAGGATDYTGCGHADPSHSFAGGRAEYNNGACDGWLRALPNDLYSIGYYVAEDLAFFGPAARAWTVCDRYFCAFLGGTEPNRLYQHAAQTDRRDNTGAVTTLPTIWDRLAVHGLAARYYYAKQSFLKFWGTKYDAISQPFSAFVRDCTTGALPQVAFVDPDLGFNSDHPHQDLRDGEAFLASVYKAVTTSPAWSSTVLVINFDEWGGFFDHVPPPVASVPAADLAAGATDGLRGFRVPCLIISPFARRAYVSSTVFDHTSVLRMIEWRWGLEPLTVRDTSANNLALAMDFTRRDLTAPDITVAPGPFRSPCE